MMEISVTCIQKAILYHHINRAIARAHRFSVFVANTLHNGHYQMHFCRLDLTGTLCFQQLNIVCTSLCMIKLELTTRLIFSFFSYGIVAIAPFSHRLAFDNQPSDIQHLRCKVNFHALVFVPHVRRLGDALVSRLRSPPGLNNASSATDFHNWENDRAGAGKYVVLHLRFDKVWLSTTLLTQFCSYNHKLCWNGVCLGIFGTTMWA